MTCPRSRKAACNPGIASIVNGVGDSSEENGANDKSFAPRTYLRSGTAAVAVGFAKNT